MQARVHAGEKWRDVIASAKSKTLIAALSAAASEDPVTANVIATELLNRVNRAPFLGAAVVSATVLVMLIALEWAFTGTPFIVEEAGARAYALMGFSAVVAAVSLSALALWRGRLPRVRAWLLRVHKRDY